MAETLETIEKARGNTDSRANKQGLQCIFWFFTLNNYSEEHIGILETIFEHECKWYIFQEETGSEGTPHLQGTICLKKKSRLTELKKFDPNIHWEATKSVKASIEYCTKYESRSGKIYSHGCALPEKIELTEPYGWQLEIMDIIKTKADNRTIHWFWEPKGKVGKSTLCKYLCVKHDALMLNGKSNDMYNMLAKFRNKRKIIICDIPRSCIGYFNYTAIENIKNGLIFSGKYEGSLFWYNWPHVIVFANEPPKTGEMSTDKIIVHRIHV